MSEPRDTGELLEVPEDQRLDEDDYLPEEDNEDAFADLSSVPDGKYVKLSTASDDEPVGWVDDEEDES